MENLSRILTRLTVALDRISAWILLPPMGAVVVVDVAMRYFFNAPFLWSLEITEFLLLLVFLLAIPECTRQDGHVRVDMLFLSLPRRGKAILNSLYSVIGIWVVILLARHSLEEFFFNWASGRTTEYLHLPIWIEYAAILVVSAVLVVLFTVRIIAAFIGSDAFDRDHLPHTGD